MSPVDPEIPPAGDEIHLPGPSVEAFLLAVCMTIALIGVTFSVVLVIGGVIGSIWVIIRWVADTRREMNELPVHTDRH